MLIALGPTAGLDQTCHAPEVFGSTLGVLQALLDLDSLMLPD